MTIETEPCSWRLPCEGRRPNSLRGRLRIRLSESTGERLFIVTSSAIGRGWLTTGDDAVFLDMEFPGSEQDYARTSFNTLAEATAAALRACERDEAGLLA